ncbi:MAG: META domain-containing protein, partial [Sedimentitalea sp.]|nr:META domain-containing protein [Sedimentitalea sp.]
TMMACPPPLDASERALRAVLDATRTVRQSARMLVFEDADGRPIAEMTAVYLR